ncbi:hypothetical protein ABIB38_004067 [Massilia sp. UYP11]
MGSTLYNKIYLGRRPLLDSSHARLALLLGVLAGAGIGWYALRSLR